jgi:hypothetical protein
VTSKMMAAIMIVLEELGTPVHRTKLVKLIYLAENLFYEHEGSTITGLGYMWDNYGPNAISNAIVKEADKLVGEDFACVKTGNSMYGGENYLYSLGPKKTDKHKSLLSPFEIQVLRDTVRRYRDHSVQAIVSASKKTTPFKNTRQYDILEMKISPAYTRLIEILKGDAEFLSTIAGGVKVGAEAEGVTLEEVKLKYAL